MSSPEPQFVPKPTDGVRNVIFLFDGTGDTEDDDMTHVCRLWEMFPKDDPNQLVYHQDGIGTHNPYGTRDPQGKGAKLGPILGLADKAIAWSLDGHLKNPYVFLVENYKNGDNIFVFGFSRGAYIARAFAGMVKALGLLPNKDPKPEIESWGSWGKRMLTLGYARHNPPRTKLELIADGYDLYSRELERPKDAAGIERQNQAYQVKMEDFRNFKLKYGSTDIFIKFIGCWDTVNSVGMAHSVRLPFTSNNNIVHVFRHALALDEHRARFKPSYWAQKKNTEPFENMGVKTDLRVITNAKEVWFAGCHCDVGGGSVKNDVRYSLAWISLRWMIRECFIAETGIMFNVDHMRLYGLDLDPVTLHPRPRSTQELMPSPNAIVQTDEGDRLYKRIGATVIGYTPFGPKKVKPERFPPYPTVGESELDARDALAPHYDQLTRNPSLWKPLEYAFLRTDVFQTNAKEGEPMFIEKRQQHQGAGRTLLLPRPKNSDEGPGKVLIHKSVYLRLKAQTAGGSGSYTPLALMVNKSLPQGHENAEKRLMFNEEFVEWVI